MDGASATGSSTEGAKQLAAASVAKAAGDVDGMRSALVAAFAAARAAGDSEALAAAALAMPTSQRFGVHPGQIPALLHEAYQAAQTPLTRCRLAAALARSWVYGGDAVRAGHFAVEAHRLAAEVATPEATADALDAALLAHWGPDDFAERVSLAARLDDVAAHVADPELRLSAHLWRLSTAWECLDILAVNRQLRALDLVAAESGAARAAFFATSRRAMHTLATDDRAAVLVMQLTAGGIDGIARDVDFLLTVSLVVGVAAALEMSDVAGEGAVALAPYAGQGVLNAGAVTFHGVVDDYLYRAGRSLGEADADRWRHTAESAYRRVGAGWWERNLRATRPPTPSTPVRSISFMKEDGGQWCVGAEGATFALADLKGLQYLRFLLERPGTDVGALALSDAVAGHPGTTLNEADLGDPLDPAALTAYRRRLLELDADLDAADTRGDQPAAAKLSAERDALLRQLRGATGLSGRRRQGGASSERARIAVRKAIATALSKIEAQDSGVARLLRDSVRTGASCRYDPNPDQPVIWMTD